MYSPTNFVVSSETGGMSTRGSVDAVQQSTFGGSIRFIETKTTRSMKRELPVGGTKLARNRLLATL
jgi:hypothetical protein